MRSCRRNNRRQTACLSKCRCRICIFRPIYSKPRNGYGIVSGLDFYFAISASGSAFNWIATVAIALPPACRENVTLTAHAYDEVTVGDVVYAVYEDHAEAIVPKYHLDKSLGADPEMPAELVFADEVEGVPVTVIPYNFSYYFKSDKDKLTKIKLPDTLEILGDSAFSGCTGLTEITLPDSVKTYGYAPFSGCTGLTKAVLPDALEIIEEGAFRATDMLTGIHLPAKVREIGAGALATLTAEQAQAADVNRDREISVDDAQTILMYYVKNSLSHTPTSWEDLLEKKQPAKLPKAIKRK